jgi:hypothetical protein
LELLELLELLDLMISSERFTHELDIEGRTGDWLS